MATARIAKDAFIGCGTQILANACVMERAKLGKQVIVNCGSIVHHECILESGSEIGPNATLCGLVKLGTNSKVGAGAVVLPRIKIGDNVLIGANSTVTRDVEDNVIIKGSPAKIYKENYLKSV